MEKAEQKEKENFEQKKVEVSPEKLSLSDIDELLGENVEVYNDLGSFYKTIDVFKNIDFKDNLKFKGVDVIDDKFDEAVYGKATVSEKILNFTTLGLAKKDLGLIKSKSKERGLLNKDVFNKEMEGKEIEIGQNTEERSGMEKIIGNMHKELSEEDLEGRRITKSFEFVDGKIIKIFQASRTEQGMIDAAGKLLNGKIETLEKGAGADLIKEKEGLEKHYSSKEKIAEMTKYLDPEAKEEIIKKISQEEADSQERIKEKEENLKSELDVFRTPFQERLGKTNELIDNFSGMLKDTKEVESKYNSQLKNINSMIEQAQRSGLFEESKREVVERLSSKKVEFEEKAKEFGVRKNIFEAKLGQLKNNKTELEKVVSKINGIGKTKKEITEEEKKKNEGKKDKREDDKKEADKPQASDSVENWSFLGESKDVKIEPKEDLKGGAEETESVNKEIEHTAKTFSEKEIENIVKTHLKVMGLLRIQDKKIQDQITINAIVNVKKMI